MPENALEVAGLRKSFGSLDVLDGIDLTVGDGEFVSVVGPSGSGKSTLFHLVGGLLQPDAGSIRIAGQDAVGKRGRIGYMPQQPALLPWRTVEDNVVLARELAGTPRRKSRAVARDWLDRAGLGGFAQAYPDALSGGMRQRVAFLRALLSDNPLLCLDEPFSALDAMLRADMHRWLLGIWEENRRSVLFVTHNIEEALLLSSTVYVFTRRPARVLERVEVPFARPRSDEAVDDPEFVRLRRHITDLLKTEPLKGPLAQ
ncbi:ABC transporter ATP-binding protein [Paractinoplanes lichenicola]|uniref:ABC transporter ATP-binding protein n=1 Tax=Paractinoplanes lichenicola TaxID=2802976 RepID=A0ABS1VEP4_9ACTN|nr:ABC transporter ATP-binding protein [Actinoplanes lichenicola]MBL7253146.1 ABC transporter ATP-binding protein [Actinoplanes lichenicola]